MSIFKVISNTVRILDWVDVGDHLGFVGIQWIDNLSTYLFSCIGDERLDGKYEKELNKLCAQNGCVRNRKGTKIYDYQGFFDKHWDLVKDNKYLLLRMIFFFFDKGKKDLALFIQDRMISGEASEELRAMLIARKLYFLNAEQKKAYLRDLLENEQYAFIKKYKKAWGLLLLYFANEILNSADYERAINVLEEITRNSAYKDYPIVYFYAKQMIGDIYFMQGKYEEARKLYGEVYDEMFLEISTKYIRLDPLSITLEKIIRDSIVAGGTGYSNLSQIDDQNRYKVIESMMTGRIVSGVDPGSKTAICYAATQKDIMLRYFATLFVSLASRNHCVRAVRAKQKNDLLLVFTEIRGIAETFINVMKNTWSPFTQEEQAEQGIFLAEHLLRLNDILEAKSNYEYVLSIIPKHLLAMLRLAEMRMLRPQDKNPNVQEQRLKEDIAFYQKCLVAARGNTTYTLLFNFFIFKASSIILSVNPGTRFGASTIQAHTKDYIDSLKNLESLMRNTPLGFYWQYMLLKKGRADFSSCSIADIQKVVSSFKEYTEATKQERYLLRSIFGTDNVAIVNTKLREMRDELNLAITDKAKAEDERKQKDEREERQRKVFDNFDEAVSAFFQGIEIPTDENALIELGLEPAKKTSFAEVVETLIAKNKELAGLLFLAFEDNSMQFQEVSIEIPYGILRSRGFAKVKFRRNESGKLSFVLFKEDGDFVQAVVAENSVLDALNNPSLFNRLFYLVFLNMFAISQDQIQIDPFGEERLLPESEELKSFNSLLTNAKIDILNMFMYANPLVQLVFQRIMTSGICDDECVRRLKEQIDIQRHLLMFKKSNYKPRVDELGNLIINLDDFKDSPLRKFFEAVHAQIIDGKILFTFILSGNIEIKGEFTQDGNMIIHLPDKGKARLEYSIILELENFILHLLNSAIFEDIREISESPITPEEKERRYAKISQLIGYPVHMKEAFGAIYRRYPKDKRRWQFIDISTVVNPFLSADLFVLVGETAERIKIFKPVTMTSTLKSDDKLFQPRFVFASKSLQRKRPIDSKTVYEYVLNIIVSKDKYKYGFGKKWSDATEQEIEEVLKYIESVKNGIEHNPLLEIDPTHDLGISFGWRFLQVKGEESGQTEKVKMYYTYVPPYIRFMELQGPSRQAVITQMTTVK